MLDELKAAYQGGDKNALWRALLHCARWKELLPEWVCEALEAVNLLDHEGDLKSFDEVFGRPTTEEKAKKRKRDYYKAIDAGRAVAEAEAKGDSRNEEWFEETGKRLGVGKTKLKELIEKSREWWLRAQVRESRPDGQGREKHPK